MPKINKDFNGLSQQEKNIVLHHSTRFNCLTDLYFLAKYILGYKDLTENFHKPLCNIIQSVNPFITQQIDPDKLKNIVIHKYLVNVQNALESKSESKKSEKTSKEKINLNNPNNTTVYNILGIKNNIHNYNNSNNLGENENSLHSLYYKTLYFGACESRTESMQNVKSDSGGGGGDMVMDSILPNSYRKLTSLPELSIENEVLRRGLSWCGTSRERLWLLFRGSFKTTLITVAHTIQLILLWPDIRILIQSHKKEGGAQEILYAIKRHFLSNETFRQVWPEYCPKSNPAGTIEWGTSDRVIVPNRSSDCAWPEGTIEIAGMQSDITGRHYDYIKNDDLVTRDSVTTETLIQKTRQVKALQRFLFNQPEWGITDNIGTFYHFNDIYNTLSKSSNITKVIIPIVENDQMPVSEWKPAVPERFSPEGCFKIKNDPTMTLEDWSNQYMLNPNPPEDQDFRPEWFERLNFFYPRSELKDRNLKIYIMVDPASKRNKKSDYTALVAIGIDSDGTKFLLDVIRDKLNPELRTNLAISLCRKYNERAIYYETIGFQDTDRYIIEQKSRQSGYWITVHEIKSSHSSKHDRIKGLIPLYARGNIRWPQEYFYYSAYEKKRLNMLELLKDEFLMFPKCEHDDMIDCHSMLLKIFEMRPSKSENSNTENIFDRLRRMTVEKKYGSPFKGFGRKVMRRGIPAVESLW